MKVGIILPCRYSSSRLPGKILMPISGKPILQIITERLSLSKAVDQLIVCTSEQTSDDPIVKYCQAHNMDYFRGSLENVSDRFLKCAEANALDWAIRINGDNLFTDYRLIDQAVSIIKTSSSEFVSNVPQRTFPTGMSVEAIRTSTYASHIQKIKANERWREHVTLYFYDHPDTVKSTFFYNDTLASAKGTQLALDTNEDFERAKIIIKNIEGFGPETSWEEVSKTAQIYA